MLAIDERHIVTKISNKEILKDRCLVIKDKELPFASSLSKVDFGVDNALLLQNIVKMPTFFLTSPAGTTLFFHPAGIVLFCFMHCS
jgi:hypothetical protein